MGYSCSRIDSLVLNELTTQLQAAYGDCNKSSNSWGPNDAESWFFEIGRENADGSVTGTVFKPVDAGRCKPVGSFKISGGKVIRFPGSTKKMREVAEAAAAARAAATNRYLIGSGGGVW